MEKLTNNTFITETISCQVLTVGPEHNGFKGGIGYVIGVYSKYFSVFKHITTQRPFKDRWKLLPFFLIQLCKFVIKLFLDQKIKIVHIHSSANGSFYRKFLIYYIAKKIYRKSVVFHIHAGRFITFYAKGNKLIKCLVEEVMNNSDLVLCLSSKWKSEFGLYFPTSKIEVLSNAIEPKEEFPTIKQKSNGEVLNILFLGLIGDNKGIFDLIDVLSNNKSLFEGKILLTIGGNGETERLKSMIDSCGLEHMVRFVGWISGIQKDELYRQSDVFILPSYSEGLPITLLEAFDFGIPVISTYVGGIPELVTDGINGFLIQPGDKQLLTHILHKLSSNPFLLHSMYSACKIAVSAYYPQTVFETLTKHYMKLLSPYAENFN